MAQAGVIAAEAGPTTLAAAAESAYATTFGWIAAGAATLVLLLAVGAAHALHPSHDRGHQSHPPYAQLNIEE